MQLPVSVRKCEVHMQRMLQEIEVNKRYEDEDESTCYSVAKIAWSGYVIDCSHCGVIYKSRQFGMAIIQKTLRYARRSRTCGMSPPPSPSSAVCGSGMPRQGAEWLPWGFPWSATANILKNVSLFRISLFSTSKDVYESSIVKLTITCNTVYFLTYLFKVLVLG